MEVFMEKSMKKLMKKFFIIGLSAITLVQGIDAKSFSDMKDSGYGWANEYVDYLTEKNLLAGYDDGTFKPQRAVSFLETLKIIESLKIGTVKNNETYDLTKYNIPAWAIGAVSYNLKIGTITLNTIDAAVKKGLINGKKYPTRGTIATLFGRAFESDKSGDISLLNYKDLNKINKEALKYLPGLVSFGIFDRNGSDGYFNGEKHIRRAEMAVIMKKALNYKEQYHSTKQDENLEVVGKVKGYDIEVITLDVLGVEKDYRLGFEIKEDIVGATVKLNITNDVAKSYTIVDRNFQTEEVVTRCEVVGSVAAGNGYVITFRNLENNKVPTEFSYYFDKNLTGIVNLKVMLTGDSISRIELK